MSQFSFYHPVEVRYGDIDPQGHVNNAKHLTYFEQARVACMKSLGTIWIRTGLMEHIGSFLTYDGLALVLLLSIGLVLWVILVFPVWVFVFSFYFLIQNTRNPTEETVAGD